MPRVSMTDQFLLSQQQQHQGAGLEGTMMDWPAAAGQSSGSGTVGIGGADEFDVPPGVGLGVGSAIKHGKNKMQLRINAHIDTSDLANTDYSQIYSPVAASKGSARRGSNSNHVGGDGGFSSNSNSN